MEILSLRSNRQTPSKTQSSFKNCKTVEYLTFIVGVVKYYHKRVRIQNHSWWMLL